MWAGFKAFREWGVDEPVQTVEHFLNAVHRKHLLNCERPPSKPHTTLQPPEVHHCAALLPCRDRNLRKAQEWSESRDEGKMEGYMQTGLDQPHPHEHHALQPIAAQKKNGDSTIAPQHPLVSCQSI